MNANPPERFIETPPDQMIVSATLTDTRPTWEKARRWFFNHPLSPEGNYFMPLINLLIWAALAGVGLWLILRKK